MEVKLKRPKTLKEGKGYLWQENTSLASDPSTQRVTFASYYTCPVFVIVLDEDGRKWRCPREEIFALETADQDGLFKALATAITNSIQEYPRS